MLNEKCQPVGFVSRLFTHPTFLLWAAFVFVAGSGIGIFGYTSGGIAGLLGDGSTYFEIANQDWLSLKFWFGDRTPLYPILIKSGGRDIHNTIMLQDGLFFAAALFTALALIEHLRLSRWLALLFSFVLFTLFLQPQMLVPMNIIMNEILYFTLVLLLIAVFLHPKRSPFWLCVICVLIWLNREESFIFVCSLFCLIVFEAAVLAGLKRTNWRVAIRSFLFPLNRQGSRQYVATIFFAVVFTGLLVVSALNMQKLKTDENNINDESRLSDLYQMRYFQDPEAIQYLVREGMPVTPTILSLARISYFNRPPAIAKSAEFKTYLQWLRQHGRAAQIKYLLTHPKAFFEPFLPGKNDITYLDKDRKTVIDPYRADQTMYDAYTAANIAGIYQYQPFYTLNGAFRFVTAVHLTPFSVVLFGIALCSVMAMALRSMQAWRMLQLYGAFLGMCWVCYMGDALEVTRHMVVGWLGLSAVTVCVFFSAAQWLWNYCRSRSHNHALM